MKQHLQGIKDIQDRKNTNEKKTTDKWELSVLCDAQTR